MNINKLLAKVKEDVSNIIDIPIEYRTLEICQQALKQDPMVLYYIPQKIDD